MAISDLNANFKEQFADSLEDLVPDSAKLVKAVKFVTRSKQPGGTYRQPVIVQREHGFTYSAPDTGASTLNAASTLVTQDAQILGNNLTLRSEISYERAARSLSSSQSFSKEIGLTTEVMMDSIYHRIECGMWYGRSGLGTVSSTTNTSSLITVAQFSAAKWAVGIWTGAEGAKVEFEDSSGTLISSSDDRIFTVTTVDAANRQITFTGTPTGITALDAETDSVPFFLGSRSTGDMVGLDKHIRNTGTLFNISASTYGLWKSNVSTVTGRLTMAKIFNAVSTAVGRGLKTGVSVYVNPDTWANLASDYAATRMTDSSYKTSKGESGSENLVFYSQNGRLEVISHAIIKASDAFILPMKHLIRVGATDVTFNTPGVGGEENFFQQSSTKDAYEIRTYSNQGVLLDAPAQAVLITGFTNDTTN